MGSSESTYHQRFHSRYNFVQTLQDHVYGLIKVYRKKQPNFDYVMVLERTVSNSQISQIKHQLDEVKQGFTMERQPNLLRLLYIEDVNRKNCGGSGLRLYIEYLNFTLRDVLDLRRSTNLPFTVQEIMYVLQCATQTYHFFKTLNCNYLALKSDTIFVTPQGLIRFSPIRIEDYSIQPSQCDCIDQPSLVYFQKSQRQYLIEIKNLLLEMVSSCPINDDNFKTSYELLTNINNSRTLQHMMTFMWKTQIQGLYIGKRPPDSTDISSEKERKGLQASSARSKHSLKGSLHVS